MLPITLVWLIVLSSVAMLTSAATLPAGTELDVRLTSEASSSQKSGQPISAVLVTPIFVNGALVLDTGATLSGNTADVRSFRAATGTDPQQPASLRLHFTKLRTSPGRELSLSCVLTAVDNARETVDNTGLVIGIDESETLEAQIDRGLNKLQENYGQLAQILNQVKSAIVKQVDPEIDFKSGVDLKLRLTRTLDLPASIPRAVLASVEPAEALATMVNAQPLRTAALKPPQPSDMTNLMFLGTLDQLQQAFHEAGWVAAAALSQASRMETVRAIIEDRGYSEAPMSILTLGGRAADLALQKQNDTFAMRHHIRIWQRPLAFNGKPVWVAAATHDISITFSPQSKSFTHGIDPHIDLERSKVVSDLLFTGAVRAVALVDRTNLPEDPSNATGDKLISDGKMAVVEF